MSQSLQAMVSGQIRPNGVNDPRIVAAFAAVPRDAFAPKALREVAYVDDDLEIAPGRYLIEPMVLARMIAAAAIKDEDLVLDAGCASGYSTAVLAHLSGFVVGLEGDPELAAHAGDVLAELGIDNAAVIEGPATRGCKKQGPYNVIMIGGGVECVPDELFDQLADGGRLVAVRLENGVGRGVVFLKTGDRVSERVAFDAQVPLLPGFEKPKAFSF